MTFLSTDSPLAPPPGRDPRTIRYLRISVTDRCNLACRYCVPKEALPLLSHDRIARYEEILKLIDLLIGFGIDKVRITGGEPLIRKGIVRFIQQIRERSAIKDIALTTNGTLLTQFGKALKESGLKRLNISLDTLNPERFGFITGRNRLEEVLAGIDHALDLGFAPVKLNTVVMRQVNDDEITDLARLSIDKPLHVRFIEYMPMGNSAVTMDQQVLVPEIRQTIENELGPLEPVERTAFDGPAARYKLPGAAGEIGFISPVSSHFCHQCNRLRLTSTGALRSCLLNRKEFDILTPLRQGMDDSGLKDLIRLAIASKPRSHALDCSSTIRIQSQMSEIGG